MSAKEMWTSFQVRQASVKKIIQARDQGLVGRDINPVDLEEQIFQRSKSEDEYLKNLLRIELGIKSECETGKLKKEEKSDIFPNHFKEGVDDSESKPHTSESKPSSHSPRRVKTPFMGSDGTSQFELERRHYHVNEVLKEKLREGKKNSSLEFVETCEEFLKELSDPQSLLSTATVDKIEKFLSINTDEEGHPDDNCDKTDHQAPVQQAIPDTLNQTNNIEVIEVSNPNNLGNDINNQVMSVTQEGAQLESVITQVIEWTLKSSNIDLAQPAAAFTTPQVIKSPALQSQINSPRSGLKIANVMSINNTIQKTGSLPSGPTISHIRSLANEEMNANRAITNRIQASNNSLPSPSEYNFIRPMNHHQLQGTNSLAIRPQQPQVQSFPNRAANYIPQSPNLISDVDWRKSAQEALLKGIMRIEEDVYKASESKEKYFQFFQGIFRYADSCLAQGRVNLNGSNVNQESTKETELEKLKKILSDESPRVQAVVKKDWLDVDANLNSMLRSLTVRGSEVDQPSKDIKLLPDDFETQIEIVLKTLSPNNVS